MDYDIILRSKGILYIKQTRNYLNSIGTKVLVEFFNLLNY